MSYNAAVPWRLLRLTWNTALLLAATGAWAADSGVQLGRQIASSGAAGAPACATCHGAKGEGMAAAGFPFLAAQGAAYLESQLKGFAAMSRNSPVMQPIAKSLDAAQMRAVAEYYAQLPAPFDAEKLSAHADTYPAGAGEGAWLANRGDWDNNIPACIQCHGPGGVGVGEHLPAIAGQSDAYLQGQLKAWKAKTRAPGPQDIMGDIAMRMSDTQIAAVADYFSKLPNASAAPQIQTGAKQ